MKRLLVAVDISEEIRQKILPLLDSLSELDVDLKVVPAENLHLTLKFLGEVDRSEIRKIEDKLSSIAKNFDKFRVSLEKVGGFPSMEKINVVWIGALNSQLTRLMKTIDKEFNYVRKSEHEEIPHLTVARVKGGRNKEEVQKFLKDNKNKNFGELMVDKIVLYESELLPDRPIYKIVKEFSLE